MALKNLRTARKLKSLWSEIFQFRCSVKRLSTSDKKFTHSYVVTDGRHEKANGSFAIILNTNIDISFFVKIFLLSMPKPFRIRVSRKMSSDVASTYICPLEIPVTSVITCVAVTTSSCCDEGPASRLFLRVSFHVGIYRAYLQQRFVCRKEAFTSRNATRK